MTLETGVAMKGESAAQGRLEENPPVFVGFIKYQSIFIALIAVIVSVLLVMFVDFEIIKELSTIFVTGLVLFVAVYYLLKIVSGFISKVIYGRKADWKKDFSLSYTNPEAEDSEHAHALAEKFSLGYLIYKEPVTEKEKKIFLPVDSSFIVGRDKSVDIYIESEYLSKSHFMIRTDKDNIYIVDLNSTNGTKLNGNRIKAGVKTVIASDSDVRSGRINFFVSVL